MAEDKIYSALHWAAKAKKSAEEASSGTSWCQLLTPYKDWYGLDDWMSGWHPALYEGQHGPKILTEVKYKRYLEYKGGYNSQSTVFVDSITTLPSNPEGVWKIPSIFKDFIPDDPSWEAESFLLCYGQSLYPDPDLLYNDELGYYVIPLGSYLQNIDKFIPYFRDGGGKIGVDSSMVFRRNDLSRDYNTDFSAQVLLNIQTNLGGNERALVRGYDNNFFNWLNTEFILLDTYLRTYILKFMQPRAAWAAMPSSKVTNLTLDVSGSTITAPANGYVELRGNTTTSGGYVRLDNTANQMYDLRQETASGYDKSAKLPVTKGNIIKYTYNNVTNVELRFIYANGSIP